MFRNRLSSLFLSVFVLGFAFLGFAQRSDAQVLLGSVSGTVTDQSGAGVPKAHVTIVNKATNIQKEADTDESELEWEDHPIEEQSVWRARYSTLRLTMKRSAHEETRRHGWLRAYSSIGRHRLR